MKKRILLVGIQIVFTIALFTNCKNDIGKPNIVEITPEKYLDLKKKIKKKTIIHFGFLIVLLV